MTYSVFGVKPYSTTYYRNGTNILYVTCTEILYLTE